MWSFSFRVVLGFLLVLLLAGFCVQSLPKVQGSLKFEEGKIAVDVYVVALDGVEVKGVVNVSMVVRGVETAIRHVNEGTETRDGNFTVMWASTKSGYSYYLNVSRYIHYDHGGGIMWTWLRTEFPVNAMLHMVRDWETYRNIVENQRECIVINVHGEIVPVPEGYSKEGWVDKIAEAMLHRNLTWVHVAGYPFYYTWREGASEKIVWGEAGFQELMKHINKPNITIQRPSTEHKLAGLSAMTEQYWMEPWPAMHEANEVSTDYPLLDSEFDGYVALPIWRIYGYNAGAVITFRKTVNDSSCGFYVHIGTNQTYDPADNPTDADLYRGYMGCAAGLWSLVSRTARETLIQEAESLILKASEEGRLEGLYEARSFLESARHWDSLYADTEFLQDVYYAMLAAEKAEKPEANPLHILLAGLGVAFAVGMVAVIWRKRNEEKTTEGNDTKLRGI